MAFWKDLSALLQVGPKVIQPQTTYDACILPFNEAAVGLNRSRRA